MVFSRFFIFFFHPAIGGTASDIWLIFFGTRTARAAKAMPQSSWAGCIAGSETFFGRLQWEIVRTLRHRGLRKSYALAMSRFQILGTAAGGLTLHAMSLFPEPRRDGCVMVRLHWGICRNVFFLFFGGWLEFYKLSPSFIIFHHPFA